MKKCFFAIMIILSASLNLAYASDCSIKIEVAGREDKSYSDEMEEGLRGKGYFVTESDVAAYKLNVHFGWACGKRSHHIFNSSVSIKNSENKNIAFAGSDASFIRELFAQRTIPRSMTRSSFKKALKSLPVCE